MLQRYTLRSRNQTINKYSTVHHNFKQKLAAKGWQFLRNGKGSHQLWQHPERGVISISIRAGRMQIARSLERKLFGL
ncbi:MAG: hypothetical protein J0L70_23120 [Leptolyngbya sp. UWPOB_LEPTO1]|uniref:hypothetical protein n=1 Tax=Leptolyngbya sp. UWPOB_LEPTO1 TaxID=2815653 RepID=UPI001AC9EDCF|nr:hypothetical protein [Leptolyngbya sp. UWPOB_LEPTO1]MBN8563432.1 hypothetical protein [Leptolyngbya sp. UWPOB_LEPTO1]